MTFLPRQTAAPREEGLLLRPSSRHMPSWMEHLANDLGDFITRHQAWAGPVLGLITFGESMVFIGAFFPATALMLIAGGLAATGILDPWSVLLWCIAGAIGGDAVSYWLGRKVGPRAWRYPAMRKRRKIVARARLFFRRYGTASIFLCRFMGPVRAFVPLIAGMTAMPQLRFQLANAGSALVWVPVMLAPGYLAGKGLQTPNAGTLSLLALAIGVLVVFAIFGKRLLRSVGR